MTTQTTRRAALVGATVLPALSLPAIAGTDPIFEKVAKYKAAWDNLCGRPGEPVDADGGCKTEGPEYWAWHDVETELLNSLADAEDDLVSTQPRTRAGAAAMVKLYVEVNADVMSERDVDFLRALLAYLESAA